MSGSVRADWRESASSHHPTLTRNSLISPFDSSSSVSRAERVYFTTAISHYILILTLSRFSIWLLSRVFASSIALVPPGIFFSIVLFCSIISLSSVSWWLIQPERIDWHSRIYPIIQSFSEKIRSLIFSFVLFEKYHNHRCIIIIDLSSWVNAIPIRLIIELISSTRSGSIHTFSTSLFFSFSSEEDFFIRIFCTSKYFSIFL